MILGNYLQVWTRFGDPDKSNIFLLDFYGKNYPKIGQISWFMIHTWKLVQHGKIYGIAYCSNLDQKSWSIVIKLIFSARYG